MRQPNTDVDILPGAMAGYYHRFQKLHLVVQAEYDIDNNLPGFSLAVVHWFREKQ